MYRYSFLYKKKKHVHNVMYTYSKQKTLAPCFYWYIVLNIKQYEMLLKQRYSLRI